MTGIQQLKGAPSATDVNSAGAIMHTDISETEGFLRKTGSEAYVAVKTNLNASTDPGVSNDTTEGYTVGSRWVNTTLDREFACLDNSEGAAVWSETTGSAAGGEANTASNVGTGGVGVLKQKAGVDLEMRNIIADSSKLTVTLDAPNNEIGIDASESDFTLGNIGGTLGISKGGTGETAKTDAFDALAPTSTKGDIIVHNGTDNIRLAVGTNDQVLTADSAEASGLKWAAAAASSGNWIYLSTTTASAVSSVDITSGITSTYPVYKFMIYGLTVSTNGAILMWRTSTDGGSTFDAGASDYEHITYGLSGNTTEQRFASTGDTSMEFSGGLYNVAGRSLYLAAYLFEPSNSSNYTMTFSEGVYYNDSGVAVGAVFGGIRVSAADVDAVRFLVSSGTFSGTILLYGLKDS